MDDWWPTLRTPPRPHRWRHVRARWPSVPSAPLAALMLDLQVRLLLADAQVALQDALGAIEHLARLETLGELAVLHLQASKLDLGAHQEPDSRDELDLGPAVLVWIAMLEVD